MCLIMTIPSANAEEPQNILDRFTGTWISTGNSFGADVKTEMMWSKTLGGQFHRIDYTIQMQNSFKGIGHYKATNTQATSGYWVDNSGDFHPLSVKLGENAISTVWGIAGKKQGRTEYRLESQGRAIVTDWILTTGGWKQFNQATFILTSSEE